MEEVSEILEKGPMDTEGLSPEDVKKWLKRAIVAHKFYLKKLMPKYNCAKKRYNSEIGYKLNKKGGISNWRAKHSDINLLQKDYKDFSASMFHRNPRVDLDARNDEESLNIENLEQKVNDDIKDNRELKRNLRSILLDEFLAGVGAICIDYDYRHSEAMDDKGNPVMVDDSGVPKLNIESNKVCHWKIPPENIIVPPWIKQYNYRTAPYKGYIDICSLEELKSDSSLDQDAVSKLKGATYKELYDRDKDNKSDDDESDDDVRHVRVFYLFLSDDGLKRLVIADEAGGIALGYDDWDKGHERDPIHILMLNDACDGFLPPSEAWILEGILQIVDYIFEKMNKHIRKSGTRTFFKEGENGLKREQIDKIVRNINQEYIGIPGLLPGTALRDAVMQVTDQMLSGDHRDMFDIALKIFDDLSRQPSFSQASVQNRKKTATETEEISRDDATQNGDYVDKFQDFLVDFFGDWARLTQRNYQGEESITVEDKKTGQSDTRTINQNSMIGDFNIDIRVESFMPPNKELKRRIIKEALTDLATFQPLLDQQGKQINGKKLVDRYVENIDMRDSEELVVDKVVRNIDQQVNDNAIHGVPFNPAELGEDTGKSLERLMQIFSDDKTMGIFEGISPGISGPEGSIVSMLRALQEQVNAKKQGASKPTTAKTDVGMNASNLGSAQ